jgi:hypothetical protein
VRLLDGPGPHHQVHLFLDEVDHPVVELHFELQVRIARGEARQRRDQQRPPERYGHVDPQPSLHRDPRAAHRLVGRLELGEDALAACQVFGAVAGKSDAPGGPVEQLAAQVPLELRHVGAHHGA